MRSKKIPDITIGNRIIGPEHPPFVIPEIGINHEGSYDKAIQCIDAAVEAGAECVKFQSHITEAEMVETDIRPGNSDDRIWDIIKRCELTENEERKIKQYCDQKEVLYLCTPFSREAADRLESMNVPAYKIGSGECNNIPLLQHIARFGKPIILSTGMNDLQSVRRSVEAIQEHGCPMMLMHCTSMYPTPYDKVRLGALRELQDAFCLPVGLSDHSLNIYTCLGAVALGASALEKHFTVSREWHGPDIPISIDPRELTELIMGSRAIHEAMGGSKTILPEEKPVIDFAYASVVSIRDIPKGDIFSLENIWIKRPGNGEIGVRDFYSLIGKRAAVDIRKDVQLARDMIDE